MSGASESFTSLRTGKWWVVQRLQGLLGAEVTESKLILLITQLANKLKDKLLGRVIVTLFRKPADREDGG